MTATDTQDKDTQIPTNLRLLLILEEVARRGVAVKPADLIEALGLAKPTVHRLLQTAEAEGFLQRDLDGRSYGPGPRLRQMSVNTVSSEHLRTARLAILRGVADEIGETCNLAIPDREGMIYLDRVETKWPLRIQLPIGTQVPFHCTASGKMYLSTLRRNTLDGFLSARGLTANTEKTITDPKAMRAEIAKIAQNGYSTDDEEFMPGMTAVAVPVFDENDRLAATLSVHAPTQRHDLTSLKQFLPLLQSGALKLSGLLAS
ncbi:IclR family transcriptional regulator [Ruegeria arenilitoris]|uniref:Acetate operon repressor n=1 Tax=Ruegeria arenilitoris TaxID=1173585 RepID=A0A238K3Y1_9RHOB|nr:IclR family transcriptional regulator [Ruegeria arenilitoris]SMX36646.1 Acetate operon repressor [Ruegeria arenilitoris]